MAWLALALGVTVNLVLGSAMWTARKLGAVRERRRQLEAAGERQERLWERRNRPLRRGRALLGRMYQRAGRKPPWQRDSAS